MMRFLPLNDASTRQIFLLLSLCYNFSMQIIFISPNADDHRTVKKVLKSHFPHFELASFKNAPPALEATEKLGDNLACFIADTAMPEEDFASVLRFFFKKTKLCPFIFIGSEEEIRKKVPPSFFSASDKNGLLARPLFSQDVKMSIQYALGWSEEQMLEHASTEVNADEYVPMKTTNFYRFDSMPCDCLAKYKEGKYLKIISKDEPYSQGIIFEQIKNGVKYLYIKKDEQIQFLQQSIKKLSTILSRHDLPVNPIIFYQIQAAGIIHEHLRTLGISEDLIGFTKIVIKSFHQNFKRFDGLISLLTAFPLKEKDMAEKSVLCAYFGEALMAKLEWNSDLAREKLGLSSLIHDATLSDEVLASLEGKEDPALKKLTPELQEEYRLHPLKAAEIAKYYTSFPEIEFIVAQHHEHPKGLGFPSRVTAYQMNAISCVFVLCNNAVIKLANKGLSKKSITSIVSEFKTIYTEGNFKGPMKILADLLEN